jgi:hypothetical protein
MDRDDIKEPTMTAQATTTRPTDIGQETIEAFGAGLRGTLIQPNDQEYETARHVWNGMIDKRPALIVRCAGVADDRRGQLRSRA